MSKGSGGYGVPYLIFNLEVNGNSISGMDTKKQFFSYSNTTVRMAELSRQMQIVQLEGEYALALKGNQGTLSDDVALLLHDPELMASTSAPVIEADHWPIDKRTATVPTEIGWLEKQHQWTGLKAIDDVARVHGKQPTRAAGRIDE